MKKALMIIAIMLMFLVVFLTPGCIKQITSETEAKSYTITVYTIDWDRIKPAVSYFESKGYYGMENELIKNNTRMDTYTAKEVISYSETSIRFIDNTGKEKFISADYIKVEQR
ncbi:unnamed protein product [marine sediment metagenome]|uniref:Uncharacterized protein n=1 Tax=marine sediment metagenome TaxID=412755 RepID=X1CQL2_9ZZZZ